jgi:hypothetical protein
MIDRPRLYYRPHLFQVISADILLQWISNVICIIFQISIKLQVLFYVRKLHKTIDRLHLEYRPWPAYQRKKVAAYGKKNTVNLGPILSIKAPTAFQFLLSNFCRDVCIRLKLHMQVYYEILQVKLEVGLGVMIFSSPGWLSRELLSWLRCRRLRHTSRKMY